MILVTNCPHDNGIYTLIDNAKGVVVKSSYTADGMARLSSEYAGYQWYLQQKKNWDSTSLRFVRHENGLYSRLYIKLFPGRAGENYKNLSYNQCNLLRAIDAYAEIWPSQKGRLAPLHGDFSLGNLIICGEDLTIIDWEHFQLAAAPWGFDLTNLLYESAFFSFKGRSALSHSDRQVFIETRKVISNLLDPEAGFKCILEDLTQFISANTSIWGNLVNKLPVMKFTSAQKNYLMQLER